MKKIFAAVALMAVTMFASAQTGLKATTSYDYDSLAGGSGSRQELAVGLAYKLPFGAIDGVLLGDRYRFGSQDDTNGFEVGYSLPMYRLGVAGIRTRVAYGHMNQIDPSGSGFKGNFGYYSAAIEGAYPLNDKLSTFVGYRFRNTTNSVSFSQNKFSAGLDYAFTPKISGRIGVAHSIERGLNYNGLTTAASYAF